jgi:two-component system NtrC family sensor kinase
VARRFVNNLLLKMALGFLIVSLVPLGVVSVFALHTANRFIESLVSSQLENMAAEKQRLLERWIAERKADVEVVAASAPVGSMQPAQIAPYLRLVESQYLVYRRFVVADAGGQVVYDSAAGEPGAEAATVGGEAWHKTAMGGDRYMSPVHVAGGQPGAVFLLAAPIAGPGGEPRGAVCATVASAAIAREVLSVSLGETGECYLVDRTGTFLAHKDPKRTLRDNIAQSESFTHIFERQDSQPVYRDYRGIRVLGASRSVAGTPWYLVVEQDEDEAFASSARLARRIYTAIALTVVGAIAFSGMLAYYVTAPVRALDQSARWLGAGDFVRALAELPRPRGDEIGTLRDAFEEMAHQLRERQARLEDRVSLTEAELERAGVRLENTIAAAARSEQLAALGRLASGVAHEIRTPLTSLKLYLQSVEEDVAVSPEQAEDFDVAMHEVARIEGTINHFLNFARPQEPVMGPIDFDRLVEDALVVVRPRANHQGVVVRPCVAKPLPPVNGDMRQLGEVLVNLLVNALEAMPEGGSLAIDVVADENGFAAGPRAWVRMDVTDSGPGIAPEDRELLFEPFFTTKATGSGLGLAIVRGTVERHGGIVRVRTGSGAGTTFSIFLPASSGDGGTWRES